jgi:hypothetical protein
MSTLGAICFASVSEEKNYFESIKILAATKNSPSGSSYLLEVIRLVIPPRS